MDRAITIEERIKRAEQIYERRKNLNTRCNTTLVNVNEKKNYKLLKKVFVQILVCFAIYYGFYNVINKEYVFSEDTINNAKKILSYDINFNNLYNSIKGIWKVPVEENEEIIIQEKGEENNILEEATLSASETNENTIENMDVVESGPKTQLEIDAEYIKQKIELINPVVGTISSEFGQREATSKIVSENHSGIDISATEGTKIVSSMSRSGNNSKII